MKAIVTGGAGFIGSTLVDKLIEKGFEVTVIDNLSTGRKENLNPKVNFVQKDIRDDLSELFDGADYVFHLAAQINVRKSLEEPKEDANINIIGSLNVISESVKAGVKKFIFSSTGGAIYSPKADPPCKEDSLVEPMSPYGIGKFTIENYLRVFKNLHDLDFVALRYSNVYGPRQNNRGEAGVVSIFINKILNDEELNVYGDGKQTRDFVYVKDVASANMLAIESELRGVFNVGTNVETSVNQIVEKLKIISGKEVGVKHTAEVVGELQRNFLDYSKLASNGWSPKYELDTGLKETYEWFSKK